MATQGSKINMSNIKNNAFSLWQFALRNVKILFKDKWAAIFTFIGPLVIIFLYLAFLKNIQVDSLMYQFPEGMIERKTASGFVDLWMIASVLSVTSMTTALNALAYIVYDKENGITKDLWVSPVKPSVITIGYALSAVIITVMVNLVLFFVCMIYIAATGIFVIDAATFFALLGLLLLSCISAIALMMPIVGLFKTSAASGVFNGIFSGVIGFLVGAYMPISTFAVGMQYVANVLPGSHSSALFRNLLMDSALPKLLERLPQEVVGGVSSNIKEIFSFKLNFFGISVGTDVMWIYLASSIVVFFVLNIILERIKIKKMYL